ncbi:MAG TPA: phosphatidylglycerophosphatase A [Lacunisphaera sp.]|nr:phosphatidylglycerophosphatase A [Lacunisphaera sp.]
MKLSQPGWPRILPRGVVVGLATLGPVGMRLPAPGTWGSAAGVLYFLACFGHARWEVVFAWTVLAGYVAVALCGEAELRLGRRDPGQVILDEFVVMPLVFMGWRAGALVAWPHWGVLLAGFALFRLYDILKPFGIRRLQSWPGGWGVVVDDVAAAVAAWATLHLMAALWAWR